ncbi:MAG: SpaA isopeptide-forming pilin-related protein, partial [Corynebacterium striatum]|nr:SpaA isopeptide-forming pilin-related protein [Corynebacterium striatum]
TGSPSTKLITSGGDNRSSTAQGYGVPISSFAANTGTTNNDYCVLETKAPEGYVRNPEPQHVTIDVNARTLAVSVENQKNNIINQLPATGAWGIVLVFLVGLLLLARGLYTSYKDNRAQA